MAYFVFNIASKILNCSTSIGVILPENDRFKGMSIEEFCDPNHKFKTLWLLHGGGDDYAGWVKKSCILELAHRYKIAVIMPDARNSGYFDRGTYRMWTYMNEELMPLMRYYFPLSDKREDNFLAGLSMGGMGACHWAFACPEKFTAVAGLSCGPYGLKYLRDHPEEPNAARFLPRYKYDPEAIEREDLWDIAKRLVESGADIPRFYLATGTEDSTGACDNQRMFERFAKEIGFPAKFFYGPGDHDWVFWTEQIRVAFEFFGLEPQD